MAHLHNEEGSAFIMSQIQVSNLTYSYDTSYDNIFENTSFTIDTDWKLGLIGRNGKGKTTFLNLLLGKYDYSGSISHSTCFDYFPCPVTQAQEKMITADLAEELVPDFELWKVCRELDSLSADAEILYRPYETLSHGERTKIMLALLFSRDNHFLLIDEPTNHLDISARTLLRDYLCAKKGFLLVSHDRWLLNECVDHILVLNRSTIRVEKGNFDSWYTNKEKQDSFEQTENEKLKKEIGKLKEAARRTAMWADKAEGRKIGYDPAREQNRFIGTRAYIGAKSARMQQQRKNLDNRRAAAIEEKETLLKDIETVVDLKLPTLTHHKQILIRADHLNLGYGESTIVQDLTFSLGQGERVWLQGPNGCGKSTLIKALLGDASIAISGELQLASGLTVSYINQDTSNVAGTLQDYIRSANMDESLFKAILRQLDFARTQFDKRLEEYSEGQKKKLLIATSLLTPAHLYIWDEPLNYIDIFSRMQLEKLILTHRPTLLFVEHDRTFGEKMATKTIEMKI